MIPDLHYTDRRLAALYDLECGWSADRQFYLELAGQDPIDVLDIGCGTGLLCDAYAAKGHLVAGADPAAAMLELARQKPHGDKIDWHPSVAQDLQLERKFDLITMTGHAFQTLMTDADILALLRSVSAHLKPGGRFVFESRNPAQDWANRWHKSCVALVHAGAKVKISRVVTSNADGRIQFETHYLLAGERLISKSDLRFATKCELHRLIEQSDLSIGAIFGDWDRSAFDPRRSDEMIFCLSKK